MKTANKYKLLLAEILGEQIERSPVPIISEERLVEALTCGPALDEKEKKSIWLSPSVRNAYLAVKKYLVRELEERLVAANMDTQLYAQAASSNTDLLTYKSAKNDFTVVIENSTVKNQLKLVSLRLSKRFQTEIAPMRVVRLVDDGNLEWIAGTLNSFGEINAIWPHESVTPNERLTKHTLRIVFG